MSEFLEKYWFRFDDKIRFLFVGGFNFCMSYIIYSILCILMGTGFYQKALALSWIFGSIISFTTQKYFVFRGNGNWFHEYIKCCSTWFISYCINAGLLELCVKNLKINVFISQIIATFVAATFTYIVFKKFAFRPR